MTLCTPFRGDMDPHTWHREPQTDEWINVTLDHHERNKFGVIMRCRYCLHTSPEMTPREFSTRYGVPMETPVKVIARSMRCGQCGRPAGEWALVKNSVPRAREL